jgi:predicted O-methyltransferase YrrM
MRVLEFGSGMGTMWWSRRVRDVVAVEHHPGWAKHVAASCTARVVDVPADDANEYVRAARECAPYDIVVVDGIFRNECMAVAGDLLRDGGVVVLDDAQRGEYQPGIDALRNRGYRVVEFHGPQPVSKHAGCTAVFYRDGNVLGL